MYNTKLLLARRGNEMLLLRVEGREPFQQITKVIDLNILLEEDRIVSQKDQKVLIETISEKWDQYAMTDYRTTPMIQRLPETEVIKRTYSKEDMVLWTERYHSMDYSSFLIYLMREYDLDMDSAKEIYAEVEKQTKE